MTAKRIIIVLVVIISTARIGSLVYHIRDFFGTLSPIFNHLNADYDEKMDLKYPEYYQFIRTAKSLIPLDSNIYLTICQTATMSSALILNLHNYPLTMTLLYPRDVILSSPGDVTDKNNRPAFIINCIQQPPQPSARKIYSFSIVNIWQL
jgi:hypothetical protein